MSTYTYARVSTIDQAVNTSLAAQRLRTDAVATLHGLVPDRQFKDAGVSGATPLAERPEGAELMRLLTAGDTLIVAKLDRLFRDTADALTLAKMWRKQGISLICADISTDPVTSDGVGQAILGMMSVMAEWERSRIRERTRAGYEARKATGAYMGGQMPWGHHMVDGVPAPLPWYEPARVLAAKRRAEGASIRQIQQEIGSQHPISFETTRRMLAEPGR